MVDLEIEALRSRGIDVSAHVRESDQLSGSTATKVEAALAPIQPAFALRRLRGLLRDTRPDVLHLHNPFPLIPPAIVSVARQEGIPVVQTLHNGRHGCPKTDFTRDGHPCTDCLGHAFPAPSVIHRCYRGSAPQSMLIATSLAMHRRAFARVDRYIAVSASLKDALAGSHLPPERIVVVPHGIPDPGPSESEGEYFLFLGRIEEEKGILTLLEAWREVGAKSRWPLVVVGSGRLDEHVREAARTLPNISYLGRVTPDEVRRQMSGALAVVVPSMVPESFGLATIEAFAAGRPVIASAVGALNELVDDAVGWRIRSAAELAETIRSFDDAEAGRRGAAARRRFLQRFTLDHATDGLLEVFESVSGCTR